MEAKTILVEEFNLGSGFDIRDVKIPNDIKTIEKILFTATFTGSLGVSSGLVHCEASISYPSWNNMDLQDIPINLSNDSTINKDSFDVNIPTEYLKSKLRVSMVKLTERPVTANNLTYKMYLICS